MRKLTIKEIEKFANRKGVHKFAVENFLMSMGTKRNIALMNLGLDTGLYNWGSKTIKAITDGILLASLKE